MTFLHNPASTGHLIRLAILTGLFLFSGACFATSVKQIHFSDLCEKSKLIVEGRVIQINSKLDADNGNIYTYVTIDVFDTIKGTAPGGPIELEFLGGTIGDMSLSVGEMTIPKLGESGIYFLENPDARQINPLLGWDQGRFLINEDSDGFERVLTANGQPVIDIEKGAKPKNTAHTLSRGTASGLRIGADRTLKQSAITVFEFKRLIREAESID